MTTSPADPRHTIQLFDEPSRWRAEAANALGLSVEETVAALSPGASFPGALSSMVDGLRGASRVLVDIGAGAGGASEWLRVATGATVLAVEPAAGARSVATECFPHLIVVDGQAAQTGLPDACADVITLCGVTSLLEELDPVLDEVARIAAPLAFLAITDLFAHDRRIHSEPNVFRTITETIELLEHRNWVIASVGCGQATVGESWAHTARRVHTWIQHHCADRPGFDEWQRDGQHLQGHIDRGEVLGGSVVATLRVGHHR